MPSYRQNKPEADILMNSMRSMGYTFESAIADILSKTLAIRLLEQSCITLIQILEQEEINIQTAGNAFGSTEVKCDIMI